MIEEQPRPGSIGLTSINGPVGWGIRLGQLLNGSGFSRYEHAFLVLDDGTVIEAQPGGAEIVPLRKYEERAPLGLVVPPSRADCRTVYVAPSGLTVEQRLTIVEAGCKLAGVPYGFSDYLALALRRFHVPAPWLRRKIASNKSLICSQLVDLAYQRAGVQLFNDGRIPGDVTPADLYDLLGREEEQR